MKKLNKAALYNGLLTSFFWLVQFSDLLRVKWFFDTLMQDSAVASWAMTLVVEMGMGLLSLDLLRRVTANAQRTWRTAKDGTRKQIGYKQPLTLLMFSVSVLGILESFISIAFFYEFGQVTKLTSRLLGGDTLYTAAAFGVLGAVLTFVFAAVEGERTRIAEQGREKAEAKAEAKQAREKAKREKASAEQERAEAERKIVEAEQERAEAEREEAEANPYICKRCGERFPTQQARAGHMRWCGREERGAESRSRGPLPDEQVALVLQTDCPIKEKAWMLSLLDLDRETMAELLDVSTDYVLNSLEEMPEDINA